MLLQLAQPQGIFASVKAPQVGVWRSSRTKWYHTLVINIMKDMAEDISIFKSQLQTLLFPLIWLTIN